MAIFDLFAPSLVALPPFDPCRWREQTDERRARIAAACLVKKVVASKPAPIQKPKRRYDPDVSKYYMDGTVAYHFPHIVPTGKQVLTAKRIVCIVAIHFGFSADDLKATRRDGAVVRARQMAYWILRDVKGMSLPEIGRALGGRDHTSVLHGVRKLNSKIAAGDQETLAAIAEIKAKLGVAQ